MRRILVLSITIAVLATACGGSGGTLSSAAWCDNAKKVDEASNAFDTPTADNIREFAKQIRDSRSSAPAEIKDDVNLLSEFLQIMVKAVDENDGNILLAFDSMTAELNDPKYEQAGNRITAYNERECGIVDTSSSDTGSGTADGTGDTIPSGNDTAPIDGSTDTIVPPDGIVAGLAQEMGITEDQARCLVSKLDFTTGETPPISELMSSFTDCGIDPLALGAGG